MLEVAIQGQARLFKCPHRLAWSRTPAFHAGNAGSNPAGDAQRFSWVTCTVTYDIPGGAGFYPKRKHGVERPQWDCGGSNYDSKVLSFWGAVFLNRGEIIYRR